MCNNVFEENLHIQLFRSQLTTFCEKISNKNLLQLRDYYCLIIIIIDSKSGFDEYFPFLYYIIIIFEKHGIQIQRTNFLFAKLCTHEREPENQINELL